MWAEVSSVALAVMSLRVTSLWSRGFHSVCVCFTFQLQHEKAELEQHLEQEQEFQVNKLMKKIKKLENDTISKQLTLEQVSMESSRHTFPPLTAPTVLSSLRVPWGLSGKNISQLFFPRGDFVSEGSTEGLHSTCSLSRTLSLSLTAVNKPWGDVVLFWLTGRKR